MGRVRDRLDRPTTRRTVLWTGVGAAAAGALGGSSPYLVGLLRGGDRGMEDLGGRPLQVYTSYDQTANKHRALLVDQWNAMHPRHPAELVELSPIADLTYSTVHARLQARDPDVDVVELDYPWIGEFQAEDYIGVLREVDGTGFIDAPFDAGVIDGRVYALPFNADVGMLYYRKDFVTDDRASAVADWRGLRTLVREVLGTGGFEAGIAMQLDAYEGFTVNVWEYLLANGTPTGPNGTVDFGPESEALGHLVDLAGDLHPELSGQPALPPVILPASLQYDEDASLTAFQEGRTPFLRHWPRVAPILQACDAPLEVGVVPMPGGVIGGQSLAVNKASTRPNAAQALIEFMTGPASQQLLFERGGFAATRPEPYFDAIARLAIIAEAAEEGEDAARRCGGDGGAPAPRPEAEALHAALDAAGRRPAVERYSQFSRAFQEELHPWYEEAARPELDGLEEALDEAVAGR